MISTSSVASAGQEADIENIPMASKSMTASVKTQRKPLSDSTNKHGQSEKFQSASATTEAPIVETEPKAIETQEAKVGEEGFVIWEDSEASETERDPMDEIGRLRSALSNALEENRLLNAKIALMASEHEELEELRKELELVYELYHAAKT